MFAKVAVTFLALAAAVSAGPIAARESSSLAKRTEWPSFNSWGGHQSLDHFDDWYGVDDFSGHHVEQVVVKKKELVCRHVPIEIVQQRLVVIREMAKKIITETICEVETQVIAFEQFHGSLGGFSRDLRRHSGREIGYDQSVISHWGDFFDNNGVLSDHDFGFSGHDVGRNLATIGGDNWVEGSSQVSVGQAFDLAKSAFVSED